MKGILIFGKNFIVVGCLDQIELNPPELGTTCPNLGWTSRQANWLTEKACFEMDDPPKTLWNKHPVESVYALDIIFSNIISRGF